MHFRYGGSDAAARPRLNRPSRAEERAAKDMNEDIPYTGIHELSRLLRAQELSPVDVVRACLQRIEESGPALNAFITVLADQALEQASAAEADLRAGAWRGPLHGIPVGIKDFYDTAGIRTTAAAEQLKNRVPPKDAAGVAKLRAAGAILIGKTNMHSLGMGTTGLESFFGPVCNPWDPSFIPGGSSAGSAAAVAAGLCYATLDTDAIGSCRLPAACCGVVGFKGTYGLISPQGILEGEQPPDETIVWLNHPGITARNVEDVALVLDVLAEPSERMKTADFFGSLAKDRRLRVGVANNLKASRELTVVFEQAVETVRSFADPMRSVAVPFRDPEKGVANIESDRQEIAGKAFHDVDLILLPTTTTTTLPITEARGNPLALSPENTAFANYYGLPAISVPCGFDANDLPLGLQIVGKPWDEAAVLRLAYQFQNATSYGARHPVVKAG